MGSKFFFEGGRVFCFLIKIDVKQYKTDEFIDSVNSYSAKIRKQKGCLGFNVYQHSKQGNSYRLVGEWKTRKAMEKHFQTSEYELLLGAAKVLGETFTIEIAEVSKTGGFDWARKQIKSPKA